MKNSRMLMLFGLSLLGFFGISSSFKINTTNPTYNVNLAPFIQDLSAYYCLLNVSSDCPGKFTLHVGGWLNISANETQAFCEGGCAQHTQQLLKCVKYVKQNYVFRNKATINNLNDTINIGCTHGFNGTSLTSASGSVIATASSFSVFALLALLLY
ncbi:uncharacterized protein LOC128129336 [Lactuca sativa]|uniref:uncharacterized protein LOC128129336 n=1 Tax=Lactuca sativa TaxID=4236 RepID=UPI0022B00DD4|nr:uncharacterized protein LOC128129336 [Lactuca sativa]